MAQLPHKGQGVFLSTLLYNVSDVSPHGHTMAAAIPDTTGRYDSISENGSTSTSVSLFISEENFYQEPPIRFPLRCKWSGTVPVQAEINHWRGEFNFMISLDQLLFTWGGSHSVLNKKYEDIRQQMSSQLFFIVVWFSCHLFPPEVLFHQICVYLFWLILSGCWIPFHVLLLFFVGSLGLRTCY